MIIGSMAEPCSTRHQTTEKNKTGLFRNILNKPRATSYLHLTYLALLMSEGVWGRLWPQVNLEIERAKKVPKTDE